MKSFFECHVPPTLNSNINQCFENSKVVLFTEQHVKWLYAKLETNVKYINNKNLSKLNRNKSSCRAVFFKKNLLPKLTWQSFLQLISTDPALPTAQTATVTHISNLNV